VPGTAAGAQVRFDDLMSSLVKKGKPVWSSPDVQTKMGAKDALCKISQLSCGMIDTAAYYDPAELEAGFKKSCAFQPRVIKQNRGSAGEGIWLCWLQGKDYCKNFGDALLDDSDKLKLMEMNDNHVEYHTVGEFLEFCVNGPTAKAGKWESVFPGKYLEGGKEAGGQLVDQRLLPRIVEGEVRMLMVKDTLFQMIHKKPADGGMSAVGGISDYTFYQPGDPKYADLEAKFINQDIPQLMAALEIEDQPLPVLWTSDFIPMDGPTPGSTEYVVGEFNCSCVGISWFGAACGPKKSLADVTDANYLAGSKLTNLIGIKAVEMLNEVKAAAVIQFLKPGEKALLVSEVKKYGWINPFPQRRTLVLTDQKRIFYLDIGKGVVKGEIPWVPELAVKVENDTKFKICVPHRNYSIEELNGKAMEWEKQIKALM